MNTTRIQNTLETLFQDSARWLHPGRRVVFWYDPEQQFTSSFNELQLEGVEKLQLADTAFTVKYHLLVEQPNQTFLLYAPFAEPAPQENWLLDIQKSGLTFSADPAALIYADYRYPNLVLGLVLVLWAILLPNDQSGFGRPSAHQYFGYSGQQCNAQLTVLVLAK